MVVAAQALLVTVAVKHLGPVRTSLWRRLQLLGLASRHTVCPASSAQAKQAVRAVRRAGLLFPGRAARLEESVAAVLTLARCDSG